MAAAMPFSNMAGLVVYGHKELRKKKKKKGGDKEEKGKKRKKKDEKGKKKTKKEENRMNSFLKQIIKDGAGTC